MENSPDNINVEVAYALPHHQKIIELKVVRGCTALEAAQQSDITSHFPGLDLSNAAMGIFSKPLDGKTLALAKDYQLEEGDRVEIYRPKLFDPMEIRRLRAEKVRDAQKNRKIKQEDKKA